MYVERPMVETSSPEPYIYRHGDDATENKEQRDAKSTIGIQWTEVRRSYCDLDESYYLYTYGLI